MNILIFFLQFLFENWSRYVKTFFKTNIVRVDTCN